MGLRVDGHDDGFGYIKNGQPLFQEEEVSDVNKNSTITVPVGQPVVTNKEDKPLTGVELEHQDVNKEKPAAAEKQVVSAADQQKAETLAKNDSKYRVFAERTIVDDASLKAKEDEIARNYYQIRTMTDAEIKNHAKKYVENTFSADTDKKVLEDTENEIITAYTHIRSMSNNDIRSTANYFAKNLRNKENFDNTITYYDKAEYKAAQKEREEAYDQLYAQFRNQGMSKKEAKRKANSMLVENKYLRKTWFGIHSARKAVNNNKELFFDENGKFSNEKYHEFALKQANINNQNAGEETDYTFSLKERRKADIDNVLQDASMTTLGKVVRKSGIEVERNNTALYRGLAIAGLIGAGVATGGITATAAAGSASGSTAGAAAGSAAAAGAASSAAAGATATAHISGAFLGAAASPLALLFKDKGRADGHALKIYTYTEKPKPEPEQPQVQQPQVEEPVEDCPRETRTIQEEYCRHEVQKKGRKTELWHTLIPNTYRHLDDTKLSYREAKRVWRELKRKNGIDLDDGIMPDYVNLFTNVNGIKYKVNCGADPVMVTVTPGGKAKARGNAIIDNEFCGKDCHKTYVFPSQAAADEWKRTGVLPEGTIEKK